MREVELSGISIVGAGTFNPAIVHPLWLQEKGLIAENLAEDALNPEGSQPCITSPGLATFVADWLTVQVTQEQAVLATVEEARQDELRDFARGFFELLPETPVDALGINADAHFRLESEQKWHEFGDLFLPKDFWEPLFEGPDWVARSDGARVGMRSMKTEVVRSANGVPGHVRTELAPSSRLQPNGIYAGINSHFQLSSALDSRANAARAADVLVDNWSQTRALELKLIEQLLEAV